jgi:DNA mismatch repair protein MutL
LGKIKLLSPYLADLIAAGEVVERPASVIKELMENSIDAGAKNISVEIRSGGRELIRITDDGCGMSAEDAANAFFRHATSKLYDERGLEAIGTLGFRGEALSSIAAVSELELYTREEGSPKMTSLKLKAGEITDFHEGGGPLGTTVVVKGIFYNTPARLKFLKSDRAEAAACKKAASNIALSHPEVSVKFIKDGVQEFLTPGDGDILNCIYAVLGRELSFDLIPLQSDYENIRVRGFISKPHKARGNRAMQYFFINGRFVRSPLLLSALEGAYKNNILKGRYPAAVIYLDIKLSQIDVNVHPQKTEVRFSNEKEVFDAVYYSVLTALSKPEVSPLAADEPTSGAAEPAPKQAPTPARLSPKLSKSSADFEPRTVQSEANKELYRLLYDESLFKKEEPKKTASPAAVLKEPQAEYKAVSEKAQETEALSEPPRIIGEALKLYILCEYEDSLYIIDKHAVHERIIFNALLEQRNSPPAQALLSPQIISLDEESSLRLAEEREDLNKLGFEIDDFGPSTFIVRAVPRGISAADTEPLLEELLSGVRSLRDAGDKKQEERLKTVACRAALKAGDSAEPEELLELCKKVLSGEIRSCPHGRPVVFSYSRNELDKLFDRIV